MRHPKGANFSVMAGFPFLDAGKKEIKFLLGLYLGIKDERRDTTMVKKHTNMDPVVHFEMPAEDRKRMVDFYT